MSALGSNLKKNGLSDLSLIQGLIKNVLSVLLNIVFVFFLS